MHSLRVRGFNVRFGDAILVSVPDLGPDGVTTVRHILIDTGNVLAGPGGVDAVFGPVLENILAELGDKPLDLYVMTHEHLDHVQGLLWASEKQGLNLKATHAWLTASAASDYYETHPEAHEKRLELEDTYRKIALYFKTTAVEPSPNARALMLNNNPRSTRDCVEFLRGFGETTTYVFRGVDLAGRHPFQELRFEIWGPEEDTSIYYGLFRPMSLGLTEQESVAEARVGSPIPPPGVDAGAFYNLVNRRRYRLFDNILAIDKAANNTSVVFVLEWRGWRLLFPGDAEHRAWKEMNKQGFLNPVHFIKVGHHGSWNGTPQLDLLDKVLPQNAHDGRTRRALVSTHEGTYLEVPSAETLEELRHRCEEVIPIGEPEDALFVDIHFPDEG